MAKFRKKPVVIEAVQWNGRNWDEMYDFTKDESGLSMLTGPHPQIEDYGRVGDKMCATIETLEGLMTARQGDWIIRGVKGEFYPCKPDIFAATYEPADQPHDAGSRERMLIETALRMERDYLRSITGPNNYNFLGQPTIESVLAECERVKEGK